MLERDERHREHQRNRQGHHQPGAQTKAQEADGEHGFANLEYRLGDIEDPPIEKGTIDLAILSQALHHAPHPERAIASAHRILKKGGRLVILDLLSHRFERARELYADQWLGFSEVQLHQWLEEAGFGKLEVTVVSREKESPHFQTVFATGSK
ncbi:MAG: methyltransferase domain-containing protein [Chthoniobacterales bacterium]|nr:methyltransferase domain-containing protein [Chthoniobacterales bacterium]